MHICQISPKFYLKFGVHFHNPEILGLSLNHSMQNLAGSALFLPQGGTHFQLVSLGSPQGYFIGKFSSLTSIKFLPPMPPIQK